MAVCRASIGDAPEFRAQYVRLVAETDRVVTHVAAEIGIGAQLLGRWVAIGFGKNWRTSG